MNDVPLTAVDGVTVGANAVAACKERRMLERRPGRRRDVTLCDQSGGEWRAHLLDYYAHGCLLEMTQCPQLADENEPFHVSIPSIGANGDAVLLPATEGARAVFLHDAFGSLGTLPVTTVEMSVPGAAPAGRRRVSLAERLVSLPDE